MKKLLLLTVLSLFISTPVWAEIDKFNVPYAELQKEVQAEVNKIADDCWNNAFKNNPESTMEMRKAAFAGIKCVEAVTKKEIEKTFSDEEHKQKALKDFETFEKTMSAYYWNLHNNNKHCYCGTVAQLTYYVPWLEQLKLILENTIMMNRYQR